MNLMSVDGHKARIEYDPDTDLFRGEILGLNGGADFYGKTPNELRREFKKSMRVFLEVCKEQDIDPFKNYSGRFNLRVTPELHGEMAVRATSKGKSLNQWICETLEEAVQIS
jgi:predicted HicB family RNase H-like nuclease